MSVDQFRFNTELFGLGGVGVADVAALNDIGRLDEAEQNYRRAAELKPDYAEAYNNLGNVLASVGRLDEVERYYRRAVELKPNYAEAYRNLFSIRKIEERDSVIGSVEKLYGETSASALRCMAAGQPTLVSNVDANRELPDECVLKIPVGAPEEAILTRALRTLAAEPLARQALGSAAREYVASHHTLEQAARSYILFLEDLIQRPRPLRVTAASDEQMRPAAGSGNLQEIAHHLRSLSMDAHTLPWLSPVTNAIADLGLWKPQTEKED